ncbi:MAG: flavin reductase family protein [Methanoregula sp.]|nr:flavin reductase family protein [Methanoregula sp.]
MKRSFGARTAAYPLPVFLIGTYDARNRPDAMAAAWGGICSSDPPSIAVSIRPTRQTYKNILEKKAFTVSIPSVDQMAEADFFGVASGADTDKFEKTGLTPVKAEFVDAPFVGECPVVIECRLIRMVELGAHTQFVGEILDVKIDESVLDADGKPVLAKIRPFGFDALMSEYYGTGPVVGKAFSAGRKFKD